MSDMIEVTADALAQRAAEEQRQRYEEHQRLVALAQQLNSVPMTVEQMRVAVAQADAMRADTAAFAAQRARERAEQEREAARMKAEQERQEQEAHAATVKAQKRADWRARGMGSDVEFEHEWRTNRHAFFPQNEVDEDEAYRRRKRAEGIYR